MRKSFWIHLFLVLFFCTPFAVQSQINKDSLVLVMETTTVDSVKVKLLIQLSNLYSLTDLKKSFGYAIQAVEIAQKRKLKGSLLEAYKVAGKICFDMGLIEDAAQYFNFCLELINEKGNKLDMAMANLNVGAIWLYMEKIEKAEVYHLKSLQLLTEYAKDKNDTILPPYVINIYNNLGIIYRKKGDAVKEGYYNEKGIEIAEHNPDYAQTMVFLLHNKAEWLINQSKLQEADTVLQKAIKMAESMQFIAGLAPSYDLLGQISEKKGKNIEALDHYKKGYHYAVASESNHLIQTLADKLQLNYKTVGNTDSAFKYLNIAVATQKKIKSQEANDELLNKENKRKFDEWQKESEKAHQSNYLKYIILAAFAVIIAIVFFVFYLKKRKEHDLVTLEKIEKSLSIERLELEKKLLEANIENKEKQLTNDIIYQIQKNEMIEDVVKKLLLQTKQAEGINKNVITEVISDLGQTTESNVWNEFEIRFKQVHAYFYDNLQAKFPELTRNERRLCAFLRLNMSTKEISAISGQTGKSIDVARSRLRKKLGISNAETGLVEFLSAY